MNKTPADQHEETCATADYDLTYQLADDSTVKRGHCTSLSASKLTFITNQSFQPGLALRVNVELKHHRSSPLIAFVETQQSSRLKNQCYEIVAAIQSIQGH